MSDQLKDLLAKALLIPLLLVVWLLIGLLLPVWGPVYALAWACHRLGVDFDD